MILGDDGHVVLLGGYVLGLEISRKRDIFRVGIIGFYAANRLCGNGYHNTFVSVV